jgi:hypothetical protein
VFRLANLGADFGVVGNESVLFAGVGRSYGSELLLQQRLYNGFYGLMAYTHSSAVSIADSTGGSFSAYTPSSWDNQHILSLTGGKKFEGGWEFGATAALQRRTALHTSGFEFFEH